MFDKLKQLKELKKIQKALGKERMDVEKEGTKVTVNGNIQIIDIKLNTELDTGRQEKILRECINEAVKKVQYMAAEKMQQFGNLGF